jgi:hypothetical protein
MSTSKAGERVRASYYPDMITDDFTITDAIVYQELEFWSQYAEKEHDGYKWFYKSHREIADRTKISKKQVERATKKMIDNQLLVRIHNPIFGWDHKYWYRLLQVPQMGHANAQNDKCMLPSRSLESAAQVTSLSRSGHNGVPLRSQRSDPDGTTIPVETNSSSLSIDTPKDTTVKRARDSVSVDVEDETEKQSSLRSPWKEDRPSSTQRGKVRRMKRATPQPSAKQALTSVEDGYDGPDYYLRPDGSEMDGMEKIRTNQAMTKLYGNTRSEWVGKKVSQ